MTAPAADRWCGRIVELAARVLPADQRQRYALEFVAELYGMPRPQQYRHALQILAHAWVLRTVLTADPTTTQEDLMTTTRTRRPLSCRLGLHRWDERENPETRERYEVCLHCDAYRDDGPGAAPGAGAAGMTSAGFG